MDITKNFSKTAPYLFGPEFAKQSKKHLDQVKAPDLNDISVRQAIFFKMRPKSQGASVAKRGGADSLLTENTQAKRGQNSLPRGNKDKHTCINSFEKYYGKSTVEVLESIFIDIAFYYINAVSTSSFP